MRKLDLKSIQNSKKYDVLKQTISKTSKEKTEHLYTTKLENLDVSKVQQVGGKNASLGTLIQHLSPLGIKIPDGFAVTVLAYKEFIRYNKLENKINKLLYQIPPNNIAVLHKNGAIIRDLILEGSWPIPVKEKITKSYEALSKMYESRSIDVAVRSSATCEDLPEASFAGQQESFLNIFGIEAVLIAIKECFASLFNNRAISYRQSLDIDTSSIGISVCVQKMVRSDLGASGVAFSIDTESGFKDVVLINGAFGLGESIVQGSVSTDEFLVYKPLLKKGYPAIVEKKIAKKESKLIYSEGYKKTIKETKVSSAEQTQFCLSDIQVLELSKWICLIEDYYTDFYGKWCPMDIEWALDGVSNSLYIVQARPETVHSNKKKKIFISYKLIKTEDNKIIVQGIAVGDGIGQGKVRKLTSMEEYYKIVELDPFEEGDILVTDMTDPNWEPLMKISGGIITNRGGRTCHAAIVAREMGVPAIVGTVHATEMLDEQTTVSVSCAEGTVGNVYEGIISYEIEETDIGKLPKITTNLMLNVGSPDLAFKFCQIPNSGVGLAREEFIINNYIQAHPLALLKHKELNDKALSNKIATLIEGYKNEEEFFIEKLSYGIGKIAAAFYPKDVIVRLSDFKTNEYCNLLGGSNFEPSEENPMLGWRGASRYYSESYEKAFGLECKAIKKVREKMGLSNVIVMIPFCRTVEELHKVYKTMRSYGLKRGENGLQIYLMAELPSNIIMAEDFSVHIDGFSIGSNDLTQLILGVDRDSELVAHVYDERSPAVKRAISSLIKIAKETNTKVGICGQAPSDYPDFTQFLVKEGIDSISVTPDSVLKTLRSIASIEKK
ncbi:phosphoenolpyruvate synthase [Tenacibaculum sp. nBUS_03]|uniref:phosphoenolpyruvate synthase n=1 Tax=Tenacibaculum sp. nBUS_03 TaxID=3395320 RepID=UPI003EBB891F